MPNNDTLTPEQIEALPAYAREVWKLHSAATPTPYDRKPHAEISMAEMIYAVEADGEHFGVGIGFDGDDAAYMQAACNAVPRLLRDLAEALTRLQVMNAGGQGMIRVANELDQSNDELREQLAEARRALRELCIQVEKANAVDTHGHPLKNLKALKDARVLLDAAAQVAEER